MLCSATASTGACCQLGLLGCACLHVDVPFTAVLQTWRRYKFLLTCSMSVLSYAYWVRPQAMTAAAVCICPSTTGAVSCWVCLCSGCVCGAPTAACWSCLSMWLDGASSSCLPLCQGQWCSCGLCCLHPTAGALPQQLQCGRICSSQGCFKLRELCVQAAQSQRQHPRC